MLIGGTLVPKAKDGHRPIAVSQLAEMPSQNRLFGYPLVAHQVSRRCVKAARRLGVRRHKSNASGDLRVLPSCDTWPHVHECLSVFDALACSGLAMSSAFTQSFKSLATADYKVSVSTLVEGLENPWSLAFRPEGRMLVTERRGTMRVIDKGSACAANCFRNQICAVLKRSAGDRHWHRAVCHRRNRKADLAPSSGHQRAWPRAANNQGRTDARSFR